MSLLEAVLGLEVWVGADFFEGRRLLVARMVEDVGLEEGLLVFVRLLVAQDVRGQRGVALGDYSVLDFERGVVETSVETRTNDGSIDERGPLRLFRGDVSIGTK